MSHKLPLLPLAITEASFSQKINFSHVIGFAPGEETILEQVPYEVRNQNGKLIAEGTLDQKGMTQRFVTEEKEQVTVWLGEGQWQIFSDREQNV